MYIWQRSRFYRLWVVGGMVALVAVTVVLGSSAEPGSSAPITAAIVTAGVWMAGLFALTWRRLVADRRDGSYGLGAGPAPAHVAGGDGPPAAFADLLAGLSVEPLTAQEAARTADATWDFARNGVAVMAAFVALLIVAMLLYATGVVGPQVALTPLVVLVLIGALRVPSQVERAVEVGDAWLRPLGLTTTGMPRTVAQPDGDGVRLVGSTTVGGVRHGRRVDVELASGGSTVAVRGAVEPFRGVSDAGRLQAVDGSPAWAATALALAGSDARWRRLEVTGGPEGVVVRRRGAGEGTGWLADLWLAERVAAAAPPA